ncbi:MAG: hypothetical protein DMF79_15310 [Acidobacteria bacterium]|nr:MAG: hypothetical protein DMF79_15310 [Acidobacteriota bacterium]
MVAFEATVMSTRSMGMARETSRRSRRPRVKRAVAWSTEMSMEFWVLTTSARPPAAGLSWVKTAGTSPRSTPSIVSKTKRW